MSTFVLMRLLESAPRRYDAGIELLSLGQHRRVLRRMAARVSSGDRVLDIGCGTGSLAALCAKRGARVTAIDASPAMLRLANLKIANLDLSDAVELVEMSAINLDESFDDGAFDVVVSSFAFSELSDDEQAFVLRQCARVLVGGGRLLIADEVTPRNPLVRLVARVVRFPLVVIAYVLTQTTTRAVADLESKIRAAGFDVDHVERHLLGGVALVSASRRGAP
jgi:ubiquinone/menaquinone biosynthesis C-methylase UbiE